MLNGLKKGFVFLMAFLMLSSPVLMVSAAEVESLTAQDGESVSMEDVFWDVDGDIVDTENNMDMEENTDTVSDLLQEDTAYTVSGNSVVGSNDPDPVDSFSESVSGNSSGVPMTFIPPTVVNHYATYNTTVAEEKEEYTFLEKPFEEYTVLEGFALLIFLLLCFLVFMDFFKWRSGKWRI